MYSRVPAWHPEMVFFAVTISQSILLSHGNRSGPYPDKKRGLERGVSCVVVVPRRRYSATELVLASEEVGTGKQHKDDEAHHEIK